MIVTSEAFCGVGTGAGEVYPVCPGIIRGRLKGVAAADGGVAVTDAGGRSPRALSDAMSGFSAGAAEVD